MRLRAIVAVGLVGLVGLTVLSFASAAGAVEITLLSPSTVTVAPGEAITINIGLSNTSADEVTGLFGDLSGLYAIGGVVVSGRASLENFASFCGLPFPGAVPDCFGAIPTFGTNFDPNDLSAAALGGPSSYSPGDDQVRLIQALHGPGSFSDGTGAVDPGITGVVGVFDETDITITLIANASGGVDINLSFGAGGAQFLVPTQTVTINIVPEPGTALLMGLGLAGLGVAGRRQ